MPRRNVSILKRMKTKTITMRYRDDLEEKIMLLKCREGGVSKFFEDCLDAMNVTPEELKALKVVRGK